MGGCPCGTEVQSREQGPLLWRGFAETGAGHGGRRAMPNAPCHHVTMSWHLPDVVARLALHWCIARCSSPRPHPQQVVQHAGLGVRIEWGVHGGTHQPAQVGNVGL